MNILSLFDGISCGQIALNRIGIKYKNYYASEIDKHAIKVTQTNYPNTIQLGDITKIKGENLPNISILFGGSPCQGFSFAGKQLNFKDPRSKLFFEYVRLLKETNPKYFLLENVRMKQEYQDIISNNLNIQPIEINSSLVSAQNRKRLYWTNIPNISNNIINKNLVFNDIKDVNHEYTYISHIKTQNRILTKNYLQYDINNKGNKSQSQRAYFLNSKFGTLDTTAASNAKLLENNDEVRLITRNECERLQTVPDNYTISINESKAKKCLGNGWTVDVICHILSFIPENLL